MSEKKVILSLEEYEELLKEVSQAKEIKLKNSFHLKIRESRFFYGTVWNCGIEFPDSYNEFELHAGENIKSYPGVMEVLDQATKHEKTLLEIKSLIDKLTVIIEDSISLRRKFNNEFGLLKYRLIKIPKWIKKYFEIEESRIIEIGESLSTDVATKFKNMNYETFNTHTNNTGP